MSASFFVLGNEIQTTDASPSSMGSVDVPPNSTAVVDITITARALDGTSKVFFHKSMLNNGNVLTLASNLQNIIGDTGTTSWAFDISVNSQNQLQMTITGAAATTIDWRSDGVISFFKPEA